MTITGRADSGAALRLTDLTLRYGAVSALRGVSLEVPARGIVALLGANGAGKTSVMRAVGGAWRVHGATVGGSAQWCGEDVTGWASSRIVRSGIVQVPEGRRVFAGMSVHDNLLTGRQGTTGSRREALTHVYDLFPVLRERRRQPAGLLSGGEQQMLAIGRASLGSPRLIMLDEPSLGLSPRAVGRVVQVIRDIHADGVAILLVEQNAEVALTLATDVTVLELGRVALSGPTSDPGLMERVRGLYLRSAERTGTAESEAPRRTLSRWPNPTRVR